MADSPKAAASQGRTPEDVIQMFVALGLPVCDDGAAIQAKIDAQTKRYQGYKNSPDRDLAHQANIWFKNASELTHNRAALIEAVYGKFRNQAEIALEGAISAGLKVVTPALIERLNAILRDSCRVDDNLADQFLRRYMREKDLALGRETVKPALIERLTASSEIGKVSLRWSKPAAKCDRAVIVRSGQGDKEQEFESDGNSFEDSGGALGVWYTYRIYSQYQGVTSVGFVEAAGVRIAEVTNAQPVWNGGEVRLAWQPAGPRSSVQIFRCESKAPSVKVGADGPAPDGAGTTCIYHGAGESFSDSKLKEGATYFYRIVAEFGVGCYSRGVDVQLTIPQPPPAVRSLKAEYKREADKDVVLLEWPAVTGVATPEYVVVRREGEAPAGRVDEGALVNATGQTRCLDAAVAAGHRYTYAIFTRTGGLASRTGTASPAVDILAEVAGLRASTGDGTVELSWVTPPGVSEVIVCRSLQPPQNLNDGTLVRLTGAGNAKDERLRNDTQYHYLVGCGYRPGGGGEVFSPGVRIAAVPVMLPDPAEKFAARPQGREVVCAWTPPSRGQAIVLRSDRPHGLPAGHRLRADELSRLGERIVALEGGSANDSRPELGKPYYSIFTVSGEHAVAGGSATCVVCPEVTHLSLTATRDGIILRWKWPDGCTLVRVARRLGRDPDRPDDPNAVVAPCMKTDYDAAGGKLVDRIQGDGGVYHYVVYAQPAGAPAQFFSSGAEAGCRETVDWQPGWTTIHYQLSSSARGKSKGQAIGLTWTVDECAPNFGGFALLANQDGIPQSLDDGVELFRWSPEAGPAVGRHEAQVGLEPVLRRRWARFHVKALTLNPAQRFTTLIVHPNVCVPISEKGTLQSSTAGPIARQYKRGVPKKVICPWCFSEFPIGEMRFTAYGGGDVLPGKYTLLDRILKRPPRPPVDSKGVKLTNKICPKCQKQLPFTAGGQASLVIGLIGAKFVGKSHYVAALIDRLGKQVGADLQAALIPTSEETAERYQREFHDPLFRNKLELPMTPGTPPPLIYDLRFSGSLWGEKGWRSVTLALYDTAGENFDKEDKVREMVKYLEFASGVILLIDPLQVDAVRQALPDSVRKPDADAMADPLQLVSKVYKMLEDGKIVAENSPLAVPVAVVLTKCDILADSGLLDSNRLWSSDRRHRGYFDREAHDDMVGMFGEYVRRWSPEVYNNVTLRFSRHAFFGASSTGCASDSKTRRFKYISPWRVEDPLLWLLAELGVIPSR